MGLMQGGKRRGAPPRLFHHLPAKVTKSLATFTMSVPCLRILVHTCWPFIPCTAQRPMCPPGGPTLLGLLYIAVAERVGLRTAAISLPSHFLVKPLDLPGDVYIDPYNGGRLYDTRAVGRLIHRHLHLPPPEQAAAAEALRSAVTPTPEEARKRRRAAAAAASAQPVPGPFGYGKYSCDPAYNDEYDSEEEDDTAPMFVPAAAGSGAGADMWFAPYLQPVGKREVLLRLLRNLREVYWVALVGRKVRQRVTQAGDMGQKGSQRVRNGQGRVARASSWSKH